MFDLTQMGAREAAARAELAACEAPLALRGLAFTQREIAGIVDAQSRSLRDAGRLELSGGALKGLALAFCDSPYLGRRDFAAALMTLIEAFYRLKNESDDRVDDEELIARMRDYFDGACGGSLSYLSQASYREMCGWGCRDEESEAWDE